MIKNTVTPLLVHFITEFGSKLLITVLINRIQVQGFAYGANSNMLNKGAEGELIYSYLGKYRSLRWVIEQTNEEEAIFHAVLIDPENPPAILYRGNGRVLPQTDEQYKTQIPFTIRQQEAQSLSEEVSTWVINSIKETKEED